ncbi:MFS transporter [candidate division WOR-3 bacterium]|nr:MFS transporter [candidate division WOR-3 bacterium]
MLFASTVFGRLGDTLGRKRIVIIGFIVSGIVFYGQTTIRDLGSLFLLRGLAGLGAGMIPGPLAALIGSGSIGVFTAFGSFGFMIASLIAGILTKDAYVFTASAVMCVAGFGISFFIREKVHRIKVPLFPVKVIRKNIHVYAPFLLRHSAASAIWAIFPIYMALLGVDRFMIGMLYAINPLMQFTFMLVLRNVKSSRLIATGLIASAVTFLGYAVIPHWEFLIFLQALLGFSYANLYLGSMKELLEHNEERSTVTGLLNSIIGLSGIIGPLIGGLVAFLGLRAMLYFSSGVAMVSFIASRLLMKQAR